MVSWGTAFKKAAVYVGFLILWSIIGGIFIGAGFMILGVLGLRMIGSLFGGMGLPFGYYAELPYLPQVAPEPVSLVVAVILIVIGYLIILFGTIATFFKIVAETTAEEVQRRLRS